MKCLSFSLLAFSLAAAGAATAQDYRNNPPLANGNYGSSDYDYARVIRVDPVIGYGGEQTAQNCSYRQTDEVYAGGDDGYYDRNGVYRRDERYRNNGYNGREDSHRRNGGSEGGRTMATVIGGIAGAVLGSKMGNGSGQYVGTAVGSMVGGMAGRSIYEESQRSRQAQRGTVRVCDPMPASNRYGGSYGDDDRVEGYDVTYEYAGRTYQTRTSYHPGDRMRVRVAVTPE